MDDVSLFANSSYLFPNDYKFTFKVNM